MTMLDILQAITTEPWNQLDQIPIPEFVRTFYPHDVEAECLLNRAFAERRLVGQYNFYPPRPAIGYIENITILGMAYLETERPLS